MNHHKTFAALFSLALLNTPAHADNVLFFHFASDLYVSEGNNIAGYIDAAPGTTVTIRTMTTAVYNDLASFDQIWVYDLARSGANTNANVIANSTNVANWYNARLTAATGANLILDGRILSSSSSFFEPELIRSFYSNLSSRGGGLLLGTDHCEEWCSGINQINTQIGVNPFTGFYNDTRAIVDTASPLLAGVPCTFTSGGNCLIASNTTTGFAPAGAQSNGQFLTPVAYNSTNPASVTGQAFSLTAISSTIGSTTFGTGGGVPEPGSALLLAGALGAIAWRRRGRTTRA